MGKRHPGPHDKPYDPAANELADAIALFPGEFGLKGFPGDVFRVSARSSYMSDHTPMLYTERLCEDGKWKSFAKGTVAEMEREVIRDA